MAHDYEQVHNTTDGETDSGMFKNLTYVEQETSKAGQLNSYSQVMRNNEELLASHLRVNTRPGDSRDNSESSDNDTSQLVTSQVSVRGQMVVRNSPLTAVVPTGLLFTKIYD